MNQIFQINCPTCGAVIGPDHIHGSIIYCPHCRSYKILSNNRDVLKPVFYKIYRHSGTAADYKRRIVDILAGMDIPGIFDYMRPTSELRRYYIPVREIRRDGVTTMFCLNERYSAFCAGIFRNDTVDESLAGNLPESCFADISTSDYKPMFVQRKEERVEFLPIDVSMDKIDAMYDTDQSEMLVIKYLPISVIDTNLGSITALGDGSNLRIADLGKLKTNVELEIKNHKEKKTDIRNIFHRIVSLAVVIAVIMVIYRLLTTGISAGGFFSIAGTLLMWGFLALWSVIWIGLYIVGAILIVAPPLIFLRVMFKFRKAVAVPAATDKEKGYKIFEIN